MLNNAVSPGGIAETSIKLSIESFRFDYEYEYDYDYDIRHFWPCRQLLALIWWSRSHRLFEDEFWGKCRPQMSDDYDFIITQHEMTWAIGAKNYESRSRTRRLVKSKTL